MLVAVNIVPAVLAVAPNLVKSVLFGVSITYCCPTFKEPITVVKYRLELKVAPVVNEAFVLGVNKSL